MLVNEAIDFWRSEQWLTVAKPSRGGRNLVVTVFCYDAIGRFDKTKD